MSESQVRHDLSTKLWHQLCIDVTWSRKWELSHTTSQPVLPLYTLFYNQADPMMIRVYPVPIGVLGSCTEQFAAVCVRRVLIFKPLKPKAPPRPQGVIPSRLDAWIWAGDFAYLDNPPLSCDTVPDQVECQCNATWLAAPPAGCMAGSLPNAVRRWNAQVTAYALAWGSVDKP